MMVQNLKIGQDLRKARRKKYFTYRIHTYPNSHLKIQIPSLSREIAFNWGWFEAVVFSSFQSI